MSPAAATFKRTVGMVRSTYTVAFAYAAYLAGSAALFAFNMESAEGTACSLASLWAVSAAPFLPVVSAFAGMYTWSAEISSGSVFMLLASPAREFELAWGKFLGVWSATMMAPALFLVSSFAFLSWYAPDACAASGLASFLPGFLGLAVQGAAWSAAAVCASAHTANAAGAAAAAIAFVCAVPRAVWFALSAKLLPVRRVFGEFPCDAHVFDIASGVVPAGAVLAYAILAAFALFACVKRIELLRLAGRRQKGGRFAANLSILLAAVFAGLCLSLALRMDVTFDIPCAGREGARFSPKTRGILAEARGDISAVAFMSSKDPRFRETAHFLRSIEREAAESSGARFAVRHVDPVLDIGEARRLAAAGAPARSVVLERDGRVAGFILAGDGFGEREFAAAVERAALPFRRRVIYWTTGHGELSFEDYGPAGMSDIARDLAIDGYTCKTLDFAKTDAVPGDCALIVAAGPRTGFSEAEISRLEAYLEGLGGEGGRLLSLSGPGGDDMLAPLLFQWGIAVSRPASAGEVVATWFNPRHPATAAFAGVQAVFDSPAVFSRSLAGDGDDAAGADRRRFTRLVAEGGECYAASSERGASGSDLAVRPTRIIAFGDMLFAANAPLLKRANANRNLFMDAVRYLSGRETSPGAHSPGPGFATGMKSKDRGFFLLNTAVSLPLSVFVLFSAAVAARRRR